MTPAMFPASKDGRTRIPFKQELLVDFLHTDLDLCVTILKTAHGASDTAHYRSAIERVRQGLQVIRNLADRIKHSDSRNTVNDRVNVLEGAMQSLPDAFRAKIRSTNISARTRRGFQVIFPGKRKVPLRISLNDKSPEEG